MTEPVEAVEVVEEGAWSLGGPVVAYRAAWPAEFEREAEGIAATVGDLLVGPVEHIGSTSIPGMPAKPVLDMMAPVASLDDAERAADVLAGHGWTRRPHRVDARLVVREGVAGVHLTTVGSDLWRERLLFRDTLRADADLRRRYRELKVRMTTAPTPYDSADKRGFVREVLAAGGHALRDDRHEKGPTR